MQHIRRFGFFALVAVALAGCGAVASTVLDVSTSHAKNTCPLPGSLPAPTKMCRTSAEISDGQTIVHMRTIPDAALMINGINLTTDPHLKSAITQQQAVAAANAYYGVKDPNLVSDEAVFGEEHNVYGEPTSGQLVWIVNISPLSITFPSPNPMQEYDYVVINGTTGRVITEFTYIANPTGPGNEK